MSENPQSNDLKIDFILGYGSSKWLVLRKAPSSHLRLVSSVNGLSVKHKELSCPHRWLARQLMSSSISHIEVEIELSVSDREAIQYCFYRESPEKSLDVIQKTIALGTQQRSKECPIVRSVSIKEAREIVNQIFGCGNGASINISSFGTGLKKTG